MSYDIYGNPLRRGHCEVHPHVHEEYPCSVCIQENNSRNAHKQSESEYYETMRLEHELELSQQLILELKAHVEQLHAALRHLHHNSKASGAEMGLALDVAEEVLQLTPQQSLAERDYTIAYNAFHAGVVYADTVPKGAGDTPGAANEYAKSIKDVE